MKTHPGASSSTGEPRIIARPQPANNNRLSYDLQGDILHVKETIMSFRDTKTLHWYYNISDWTMSSYGREGDPLDRRMSAGAIQWVKQHYLPKVQQPIPQFG